MFLFLSITDLHTPSIKQKRKAVSDSITDQEPETKRKCDDSVKSLAPDKLSVCLRCGEHVMSASSMFSSCFLEHICYDAKDCDKFAQCMKVIVSAMCSKEGDTLMMPVTSSANQSKFYLISGLVSCYIHSIIK